MEGTLIRNPDRSWTILYLESCDDEQHGHSTMVQKALPLHPDDAKTYDWLYQSYTSEEFNKQAANHYTFETKEEEEDFLATPESVEREIRTIKYARLRNAIGKSHTPQLRNINYAELLLMFTRLAIKVLENPEDYQNGKGIDDFFVQENYRRDLIKK